MRSGLFEAFNTPQFAQLNMKVPKNFNPRTLVAWAVKQKPYFPPGKGYHYSNTNYILLGLIIEADYEGQRRRSDQKTAADTIRIDADELSANGSHAGSVGAWLRAR